MSTNFDTSQTIVSLLGFNLGVEIGQLVFVGLILLIYKILITLKMNNIIIFSKDLFFIITLSMGMFWYVQRLFVWLHKYIKSACKQDYWDAQN